MPNNTKLVSIIIPTYNRWPVIQAAVDSCLHQTHEEIEVIIVDDGSTDETVPRLKANKDRRIRIIEQPHTGIIGKVRNIGIKESTGNWIAFLDSDDLWEPTKLSKQLSALATIEQELAWCYTSYITRIDAGTASETTQPAKLSMNSGDIFEEFLSYRGGATLPSLLLSRELQEKVGWLDESVYHDDYNYLLRLAYYAPAVAIDEPLLIINKSSDRPWTALDSFHHHQEMLKVNKLVAPLARARGFVNQLEANMDMHRRDILRAAKRIKKPLTTLRAYTAFHFNRLFKMFRHNRE